MSKSFDPFEVKPDGSISEQEQQRIIDYHTMINLTFNTEEGKKLLAMWEKQYIFSPIVIPGQPVEAHGIAEGKASFVRHIKKVLELVENNYYQSKENSNG